MSNNDKIIEIPDEYKNIEFTIGKPKKSCRPSYEFTEMQIRYAMKNSKSNLAASRFLNIHISTYKKYAIRYIDEKTGLNLYALHMNYFGRGIKKSLTKKVKDRWEDHRKYKLEDVFNGKWPDVSIAYIKKRIIREGYIPEQCCICGMDEQRIHDNKVPLLLDFIDGNRKNWAFENLRFLCFNCYYLYVGNIKGRRWDRTIVIEKTIDGDYIQIKK